MISILEHFTRQRMTRIGQREMKTRQNKTSRPSTFVDIMFPGKVLGKQLPVKFVN